MNPGQNNGDDIKLPDNDEVTSLFLKHNADRYNNFLRRFPPVTRKHIRALPLFFHVNHNLLPGYVNNPVPQTIYNYIPDAESINHARTFNSTFSYDLDAQQPESSIEAIYLQDNFKSGRVILWVIHNQNLEPEQVKLLREKAHYINKWRESRNINLQCHVALPNEMSATYWGDKYNSLHMDKSIFLDDFYSESILIAGKAPAWWYISPDAEREYEHGLDAIQSDNIELFNSLIDFGSIAHARPQDYLASAILNLINIRRCPEEAWLNILDLCHKLTVFPAIDCTSLRIKRKIYNSPDESGQYQNMYCATVNETLNLIYGREKTIVIDRTLKLISHHHDNSSQAINIYRTLLANRGDNDIEGTTNVKFGYEFVIATEILFDLIQQAFLWFIIKLESIDKDLLTPDSALRAITNNLVHQLEIKTGYIPITNINPIRNATPYDVCIRHNIENRNNSWSLMIVDHENNSFEIKHDKDPVRIAAWGVFNRIITHTTRISVSCPYMSIKQTYIADITSILLGYLVDIPATNITLDTYLTAASPMSDILIINEIQDNTLQAAKAIQICRFQVTNYGEIIFEKSNNLDGFLALVCDALSADLKAGNKPHSLLIHRIGSGICNAFILDARNIYIKICHFVFGTKKGYTHFMDVTNDRYYAISRSDNILTAHPNINPSCPEDYISNDTNIMMLFSDDVENNAVLNFLYRNNIYGYLQLFYKIDGNTSYIYILDENGFLTRCSQPFYDQKSFINQWLMFLYNTRNRIKSLSEKKTELPNVEIFELTYNKYDQLLKTRLNSSGLPDDKRYFDLKIIIQGEKGQQSIIFECEDTQFSSKEYGTDVYAALRRFLAKNFKDSSRRPVYLSDVDMPLSQIRDASQESLHMKDFIKHKINIEKRLNTIINKM